MKFNPGDIVDKDGTRCTVARVEKLGDFDYLEFVEQAGALWLASTCNLLERAKPAPINRITRQDVITFENFSTLDCYQHVATKSAIYPGQGTPLGLIYVATKLNGEAGEFAEHVGKAMRDDALITIDEVDELTDHGAMPTGLHTVQIKPLTPERRALIIKEIGDVLWYLSAACNELGISLSEAATVNLEKLCDRSERDALRGSGDER